MSIKAFGAILWKNQKLELFSLLGGIGCGILSAVNEKFRLVLCSQAAPAFDESRLALIINAAAILLGIYIAVISILATSRLGITRDMLAQKKDAQLLQIVFSGMAANTLLVFFCVLFDITTEWRCLVLITLLAIVFFSFVKFLYLMFLIFQANFVQMSTEITEEEQEKEAFFTLLHKIEQKLPKE